MCDTHAETTNLDLFMNSTQAFPTAHKSSRTRESSSNGVNVGKHLLKTKVCSLFLNGRCHYGAERCFYAHSVDELREQPQLQKTSLCPAFKRGNCARGSACKYAHSMDEMAASAKRVLCLWYQNGHCSHGNACRYSHDGEDSNPTHAPKDSYEESLIARKDSSISSTVFSPSTTPTTYSPIVPSCGSFDELDGASSLHSYSSSTLSILDLFARSQESISTPPRLSEEREDEFCARCGSSIGCICRVFDECPELLKLL